MVNVLIAAVLASWICLVFLFLTKYAKHRIAERVESNVKR